MNDQLPRKREWRKIIFFWQKGKEHSQEFRATPHADHALVFSVNKASLAPAWRQFRFLRRVLTKKEWRVFWFGILIFLAGLGAGAALLIQPHLEPVPASGGTLTEAVIGSPKLINPLYAPLNDVDRDISSLIYSGLFRLDDQINPIPDLAASYTWSADGKTLDVKIRKDAFFQDGEPVTADDVVFTYQVVKDPDWRSPLASRYRGITAIRVDDQTVQFQLDKPATDTLSLLTLGILPARIWQDVSGANAMLAEANLKPIGSGPYKASTFTRDSKGEILTYNLRKFPKYYGKQPFISDWHFQFFADQTQAETALRNHQVDALAFIPWSETTNIKNTTIQTISLEMPQETVAFFNVKDPVLKDVRMRKALSLAIDPEELKSLLPESSAVHSPFPFDANATGTAADLEGARNLLTSINWVLKDGASVRTLASKASNKISKTKTASADSGNASSTELALTISVPDQADLLKVADYLKRRWSLLGVRVTIQAVNPEDLLRTALDDRSYQVLVWNILLSPDQDLSPFWASKNTVNRGLNFSNLASRDIDTALDAISSATGTTALETARVRLAQTIENQYPAVFLLRPAYAYLVNARIHGVTNQRISRPSDRLSNTATWYIKSGWKWK
ncbi:MAG TPA: ABC transporter substrate-binding protein [Patescibacteria group bacterium]|nr:ABC transporter substrate-binding protein [Patescibacteria group bacterium]